MEVAASIGENNAVLGVIVVARDVMGHDGTLLGDSVRGRTPD